MINCIIKSLKQSSIEIYKLLNNLNINHSESIKDKINYNKVLSTTSLNKEIREVLCKTDDIKSNNINSSGDEVKNIDILANNIIKRNLSKYSDIKYLGSEEDTDLILINEKGKYLICFDPLDGSSNVSLNMTCGSIFAIYEYNPDLNNGRNIIYASYSVYGAALQYVSTLNNIVNIELYTNNEWLIYKNNVMISNNNNMYFVNEAYDNDYNDDKFRILTKKFKDDGLKLRWSGCLVAEVHKLLLSGGVFMYPDTQKNVNGKIRLLYEAYPMAFIIELAGGKSLYKLDSNKSILDINFPINIHQKTPIILFNKLINLL